jgi:hypothetical protein
MRDGGTANEQYRVAGKQSQPGEEPPGQTGGRVLLSGSAVNPSAAAYSAAPAQSLTGAMVEENASSRSPEIP